MAEEERDSQRREEGVIDVKAKELALRLGLGLVSEDEEGDLLPDITSGSCTSPDLE